ncbi:MAG: hypothetical protein RLZZ281_191, partial [Pseudomonadota bacterium]
MQKLYRIFFGHQDGSVATSLPCGLGLADGLGVVIAQCERLNR